MPETKTDTVPGLGFKDKEKALETIKNLEGRDPDYQKLAIKGLIGRAKRTLTLTKDTEKLQNIKDAMSTFEDWLKDFDKNNLSKENRPYIPLGSIELLLPLKKKYNLNDKKSESFLSAYKSAKGDYKNLRTVSSGENEPTWDIVRNTVLKDLIKNIDEKTTELWDQDLLPTKQHMELILWAYSPDASRIKKSLPKMKETITTNLKEFIHEDEEEMDDDNSEDEKKGNDDKKAIKRKSEGDTSSSSSDEETPTKKAKNN